MYCIQLDVRCHSTAIGCPLSTTNHYIGSFLGHTTVVKQQNLGIVSKYPTVFTMYMNDLWNPRLLTRLSFIVPFSVKFWCLLLSTLFLSLPPSSSINHPPQLNCSHLPLAHHLSYYTCPRFFSCLWYVRFLSLTILLSLASISLRSGLNLRVFCGHLYSPILVYTPLLPVDS